MNQPENGDANACDRRSVVEHIVILVATAIVAAAVLKAAPLQSANDRSRWATVWSLVERHTFQIDEIDAVGRWSTIDKVRYRQSESEPWHFYSSKPPLLSTIVAGLYATERATLGYGLFNETALVTRLLLLIVNVLPFYLALRSLTSCLILLEGTLSVRIFILAVAGFGTISNPYLTTLNNHTPAVACAMFAIAAAARIILTARSKQPRTAAMPDPIAMKGSDFAALGFFAALTCCFELPAAQLGVLAFLLATVIQWKLMIRFFAPAALIPLVAFFVTNWMATGGIKPFYATYGSETYVYEHNGIPSYWSNPRDLDANSESLPVYLFHCVLGHHGLLSLTPVLCVSIFGWFFSVFRNRTELSSITARRLVILSGALMTLVTLSFYLMRTENYNYGGNSVGLRWMMWLSPFWWIAMVPALERLTSRGSRIAICASLLISIVTVAWSMDRPWRPSWLYEQMEARGWIQYKTQPTPFDPKRPTVLSLIPAEFGRSFTWRSSNGQRLTLGVQAANSTVTAVVTLVATLEDTGGKKHTATYLLDRRKFDAGRPVEEFLKPASQNEVNDDGDPVNLAAILRGLPESRYFNAAGPAYVPAKSDATKAWKVERGAARVFVEDPILGSCWHRCDIQYCDQLPFGVLQWKTAINSDITGEVLDTQTWVADEGSAERTEQP